MFSRTTRLRDKPIYARLHETKQSLWNMPLRIEENMHHERDNARTIDRRGFVKASLFPAALPIANVLANAAAQTAQPGPGSVFQGPDIIDTNVHLFEWPFRKLKYDRTEALIAKLRRHRITQAWAG